VSQHKTNVRLRDPILVRSTSSVKTLNLTVEYAFQLEAFI